MVSTVDDVCEVDLEWSDVGLDDSDNVLTVVLTILSESNGIDLCPELLHEVFDDANVVDDEYCRDRCSSL